jgi:NADH dehydrogenase FAD-containing subunit
MSERWKVVIIGGGRAFCGPALELKSGGRDAYRSAKLSSRDRLAFAGNDRLPASQRFEPQKNARIWLGTVVDADIESKDVVLADGTIVPYDSLIIATGSQTSYFGHNGWQERAPGLKSSEANLMSLSGRQPS